MRREKNSASGLDTATAESTTREDVQHSTTARADALEDFRKAKIVYGVAIKAVLRGDAFARELADDALRQLNAARAELNRIDEGE